MKKINKLTLNEQHKNFVKQFTKNENNITILKTQLKKLELELDNIIKSNNMNELQQIEIKQNYIDKIRNLKNDITNIENSSNELDYYNKTKNIIYDYYNTNTNTNDNIDIINKSVNIPSIIPIYSKRKKVSYVNNIMSFLNNSTINNEINNNSSSDLTFSDTSKSLYEIKTEDNLKTENKVIDKNAMNNSYNNIINNTPLTNTYKYNICEQCGCEKKISSVDGISVCNNCGEIDYLIIESDIPNYKDNNTEKPIYPYKRLNHFIECLNQFQAKETINIPESVFENILKEFKKNKVTNIKNITLTNLRTVLKHLKLNKYYEHESYILSKITQNPPPILKYKVEEEMKQLFKKIEISFIKYCPKDRSNFFNYRYILHKIFQLLKMNKYLEYFPLLKSKEKLTYLDEIWKKVCFDLNWKFYPSVN